MSRNYVLADGLVRKRGRCFANLQKIEQQDREKFGIRGGFSGRVDFVLQLNTYCNLHVRILNCTYHHTES